MPGSDKPYTAGPGGENDRLAVIPSHWSGGCFYEIHLMYSHHLASRQKTFLYRLRELFTGKDTCQMGKSHWSVP